MKKFLIIHGPNMNFIGLKSAKDGSRITIDKIDRSLRKKAKELEVALKILRTHDESKAVAFVQRNRKITNGIIISPTSWHKGAYVLSDTLHFLEIPYNIVSITETYDTLFNQGKIFYNKDVINSYAKALADICKK